MGGGKLPTLLCGAVGRRAPRVTTTGDTRGTLLVTPVLLPEAQLKVTCLAQPCLPLAFSRIKRRVCASDRHSGEGFPPSANLPTQRAVSARRARTLFRPHFTEKQPLVSINAEGDAFLNSAPSCEKGEAGCFRQKQHRFRQNLSGVAKGGPAAGGAGCVLVSGSRLQKSRRPKPGKHQGRR